MNTWEVKNEQVLQKPKDKFLFLRPSHSSWTLRLFLRRQGWRLKKKSDLEFSGNLSLSSVNTRSVPIAHVHGWCTCASERPPRLWEMRLQELVVEEKEEWYFVSWKITQEHSWNKRSPGWEGRRAQRGSQRQKASIGGSRDPTEHMLKGRTTQLPLLKTGC